MFLWILLGLGVLWLVTGYTFCWLVRGVVEDSSVLSRVGYWLLGPLISPPVLLILLVPEKDADQRELLRDQDGQLQSRYRWHCFISYTSREDEAGEVKRFLDPLIRALQDRGVRACPVYYDGWYLQRESYPEDELAVRLREGIANSDFTLALLSPSYPGSRWCCYEWATTEEVHAGRGAPAPEYSILPLEWKSPIYEGWCTEALRTRDWLSVDASDPSSIGTAVDAVLGYVRQWQSS